MCYIERCEVENKGTAQHTGSVWCHEGNDRSINRCHRSLGAVPLSPSILGLQKGRFPEEVMLRLYEGSRWSQLVKMRLEYRKDF